MIIYLPPDNIYIIRVFLGVVIPLAAISTGLVIARLWTRYKSVAGIRLDDIIIAIAAVSWTSLGAAVFYD
jgi:hypothetical protein